MKRVARKRNEDTYQRSSRAKPRVVLLITINSSCYLSRSRSLYLDTSHVILSGTAISIKVAQWEFMRAKYQVEGQDAEKDTTPLTPSSQTWHRETPHTATIHSKLIPTRAQLKGSRCVGHRAWDELISCRLIRLLLGFPLQHSSICKKCHDSNHNEKDNAEDKHHPAVLVRPVALFARSFHNRMER